ncbi:hypothetical protein PAXRUDRAFT_825060 [Paxillus rubicundulus Ve08.2h10]|uniref:Uncharacterized protein n=1 Tax=Paxillus rubicundulus Ve08.2h10 TaxID=930991 RepID=A0A0D0DTL7_9AGAM|nr:hypothetical protein PAXRUDRAFT_825060 [Paxillus rubicundulus Ve08.2h10]
MFRLSLPITITIANHGVPLDQQRQRTDNNPYKQNGGKSYRPVDHGHASARQKLG